MSATPGSETPSEPDATGDGDFVDAVVTVPAALLPSFYAAVADWYASSETEERLGKTRH